MTIIWDNFIGLRPFEDPISDDEAARVYKWCCDEDLLRWSGGVPSDLSLAEFSKRLLDDQRDFLDQRRAFFILTRDQRAIGRIGVFAIDWTRRDGELGIVIGELTEWGKGYGTRAVALLLRHLFETTLLERVYLFTYSENIRAQRCFAACGFRTLGATQRFLPELGERAGIEMEITRREFDWQAFVERKNSNAKEKSDV
ncbi:MAG: GNAT family N-acetyltransferase [Anaerolineales bacterium]|nr:GNAT family N-acetyltransferase [Anaerolineales bacterium]